MVWTELRRSGAFTGVITWIDQFPHPEAKRIVENKSRGTEKGHLETSSGKREQTRRLASLVQSALQMLYTEYRLGGW